MENVQRRAWFELVGFYAPTEPCKKSALLTFYRQCNGFMDLFRRKVLLVQICRKEPECVESLYHVPVCLNKEVLSSTSIMTAVLGLILPLAYEFSPNLVLQVLGENSSGLELPLWAQLISLLQGVAQGTTLALLKQGCDKELVTTTGASLSGVSAPLLKPMNAHIPEDVEAIEAQRQRLQKRWGLLLNTVSESRTKS